jgi:Protein of unknown function (DUF2789)
MNRPNAAMPHGVEEMAMENPVHALSDLFRQLGLPDDAPAIERFIASHRPLAPRVALADAPFWNASQSGFLCEQIAADADWAEIVDMLDARLRA